MKKLFRKFNISRNKAYLGLFLFAVVIILGLPQAANADWLDATGNVIKLVSAAPILLALGAIAALIMVLFGQIDSIIIAALINITKYNNFINESSIINAWVIVRDLCNMFFILILLVVAFATILRIESYQWKKILPKLLIMAVLINFSRTICGLIIDASQVIMLTFVNAWGSGGDFVDMTKMTKYFASVYSEQFTIEKLKSADFSVLNIVAGMLIGIMFLIISGIVLLVALAVFVMRVVMLWIYIVLSPLAFLAAAFPSGQKYATQWWSEFVKYILNGPVLAFFIWLALISSRTITDSVNGLAPAGDTNQCFGLTQGMCLNNFLPFIISIGMLLGGLMITQQIGGVGSSIAGKGLDWAKRAPGLLGKGSMVVGGWGARKIKAGVVSEMFAKKVTTKVLGADGKWTDKVRWEGKGKVPGVSKGLGGIASALYGLELRPTKMIQGIREGLKSKTEKEESEATGASAVSLKKGGVGGLIKGLGVSRDLTEAIAGPGGVLWHKGFKQAFQATVLGGQGKMGKIENEIKIREAGRGATRSEYDEKKKEFQEKEQRLQAGYHEAEQDQLQAYNSGDSNLGDELGKTKLKINAELNELRTRGASDLVAMKRKIVPDDIRKKYDIDTEKLKEKYQSRRPIQTFYADRAQEELISKAKRTLGDNDNAEYLVDAFKDALRKGNREVAQAVLLHATQVGHLNEVIAGYKSKRDIHDEKGKLLVKQGEAMPAGGYGLKHLVQQALIEDLGIDEQTAYATQSEASTIAKSIKHTNMSESIGTRNGLLYQRDIEGPDGQIAHARGEARKVDAERYSRDYNRLAYGDEWDTPSGRIFKLNALGLDTFTEAADSINEEITRKRFNKNAAMNIAKHDSATLLAYAQKLEDEGIKYFDGKSGQYESYLELAKKLIKYGRSVADAQSEETGGIKELQREILKNQQRPT